MKLYTKTGDKGETGLVGGRRVAKDSLRVEAYGTVDELNSLAGLAAACPQAEGELRPILEVVQNHLFSLGAELATVPDADSAAGHPAPRIKPETVAEIEHLIDTLCARLEPMRYFILPGGTELAARLHVARTVCRRAERLCVALGKAEPLDEQVLVYLNRLSDLLFALARRANQLAGLPDVPWMGDHSRPEG